MKIDELRLGPLSTQHDLAIAADVLVRKENEVIRNLLALSVQRINYSQVDGAPKVLSEDDIEALLIEKVKGIVVHGAEGPQGPAGAQGPPGPQGAAGPAGPTSYDAGLLNGEPGSYYTGYTDSAVAAHDALPDPHAQYLLKSGGTVTGDLFVDQPLRIGTHQAFPYDDGGPGPWVMGWFHNPDGSEYSSEVLVTSSFENEFNYALQQLAFAATNNAGGDRINLFSIFCEHYLDDVTRRRLVVYDQFGGNYLVEVDCNGRLKLLQEGASAGLQMGGMVVLHRESGTQHIQGPAQVDGDLTVTGVLSGQLAPFVTDGTLVGLGHPLVPSYQFTVGGRTLLLPPAVGAAPRLSFGLYGTDYTTYTEYSRISVATAANEGLVGTIAGDTYILSLAGGRVVVAPMFLDGDAGGVGVNAAAGSEALLAQAKSPFHAALTLEPVPGSAAPEVEVFRIMRQGGGYATRCTQTYAWEILRGNVTLGDIEAQLTPDATHALGFSNGSPPSSSPIGGFAIRASGGVPHFHMSGGVELVLSQIPAIADADGTLADLTTKFNALLAALRARSILGS